jgi:hypothetical protein
MNDLMKYHQVNSDKWIDFIRKVISLSDEIKIFHDIRKEALDVFKVKFEA